MAICAAGGLLLVGSPVWAAKAPMRCHRLMLRQGPAMSTSDQDDKQRNREIAANEAKREIVSNVRVSTWAIVTAIVAGVIVFGIVWAWTHR
jgi:hypothetical protein